MDGRVALIKRFSVLTRQQWVLCATINQDTTNLKPCAACSDYRVGGGGNLENV